MEAPTVAHRRYARSPIEEVLCEVEFPERPASIRLVDAIQDRLRILYPNQPKAPEGIRHAQSSTVELRTSDNHASVRFNERELSVRESGTYPGWPAFKDRVHQALRVFLDAADPPSLSQINVQYRNTIHIPGRAPLIADYFTIGATIPHGLPTRFISLVTGIRAAYEDDPRNVLSLSLSVVPQERAGLHGVEAKVDIMASKIQLNEPAQLEAVLEAIENLHARASDAFETIVTDHTRRLLR